MLEIRTIEKEELQGAQYLPQLQSMLKVFKRDQILILATSALIQNTTFIMERVRQFLVLPPHKSFSRPLPHNDHVQQVVSSPLLPPLSYFLCYMS